MGGDRAGRRLATHTKLGLRLSPEEIAGIDAFLADEIETRAAAA